jgi:hypothetical protein
MNPGLEQRLAILIGSAHRLHEELYALRDHLAEGVTDAICVACNLPSSEHVLMRFSDGRICPPESRVAGPAIDPNETLRRCRHALLILANEDDGDNVGSLDQLREDFRSLDVSLVRGGDLPRDWARRRP